MHADLRTWEQCETALWHSITAEVMLNSKKLYVQQKSSWKVQSLMKKQGNEIRRKLLKFSVDTLWSDWPNVETGVQNSFFTGNRNAEKTTL